MNRYKSLIVRALLASFLCFAATILRAEVPEKFSKFEGWKGVTIRDAKSEDCPRCCEVVFPPTFAKSNDDDLKDLLTIIRHERPKEFDLKCSASANYDAMSHLVSLATKLQHDQAAEILLRPNASKELKLDGEASEIFTAERQLPVLLGYKKARSLLARYPGLETNLIKSLVYYLCNEWGYRENKKKREQIPVDLKHNGLENMAVEFQKQCNVSIQNNPDIQRMLKTK